MSGCGILGWALRLGALAVMLVLAAPAFAHEHQTQAAEHAQAAPCHQPDDGSAKHHEHNGCCCVSASCAAFLPPAMPVVMAGSSPAAFGLPASQHSRTLAGIPPPAKPPRT